MQDININTKMNTPLQWLLAINIHQNHSVMEFLRSIGAVPGVVEKQAKLYFHHPCLPICWSILPLGGRSRFTTLQELGMNLTTQEAPEAHKIHKSSPPTHFHPRVIQAITTAREEAPAGSATYKLCRELKKCSFHDSSPTLGWGSQWYGCLSHQCCCR